MYIPIDENEIKDLINQWENLNTKTEIKEAPDKCRKYFATFKFWYNMPSIKHEKTVEVFALNRTEVTDQIHSRYPNVSDLTVSTEPNKSDTRRTFI